MSSFPDRSLPIEPGCSRCPELTDAREHIAWGNVPPDADLIVVGEAPGAGDPVADRWQGGNWTGMAYTSRHSGRRIRAMFDELGYGDRTYYTNAVKCFPAAAGERTNREPTEEERQSCRGHLLSEIELIDPALVVTTGKHATVSLLDAEGRTLDGFVEVVLEVIECTDLGIRVLPILHPSYQDVWVPRIGYEPDEYLEEIGAVVDATVETEFPPSPS